MRRLAALLMFAATPVLAQSSGLEEQLRSKLREVTGQLAQAQADATPLKARAEAAEKARDVLKAQLAKAKPAVAGPSAAERARIAAMAGELAAARTKAAGAETAVASANASAQATAADARRLLAEARAERDAAQQALAAQTAAAQTSGATLAVAEAKNARLYADAKEILERYRRVGFGDVLVSREPFVGKARVRLENDAERLGDRLYQDKFNARADAPKALSAQTSTKP